MAELDEIVEQCRGQGPFATGTLRDVSNRSNRDWPWWGIELSQTRVDGTETQRATAVIELNSTIEGEPKAFKGSWRAASWYGANTNSFDERGERPLAWEKVSPELLEHTLADLLRDAEAALARFGAERDG